MNKSIIFHRIFLCNKSNNNICNNNIFTDKKHRYVYKKYYKLTTMNNKVINKDRCKQNNYQQN